MTANPLRRFPKALGPVLSALLILPPCATAQGTRTAPRLRPAPQRTAEAQASEAATAGPYIIAGTVTSSAGGRPLPHARLQLDDVRTRRPVLTTEADAEGRFRFPGVSAGKFALSGSQRGYLPASYQQHDQFSTALVTGAGIPTDTLRFQLTPLSLIFGRITDDAGDPLRDATVSLFRQTRDSGTPEILQAGGAQTDDLGGFELPNLQPGRYFLSVEATPWYAIHTRPTEHQANAAPVDPALDVAYPLTFYAGTPDSDQATAIPLVGGEQVSIDLHLTPVPALTLTLPVPTTTPNRAPPRLERRIFDTLRRPVSTQVELKGDGIVFAGLAPGEYEVTQPGLRGGRSATTVASVHLSSGSTVLPGNRGTATGSITLAVEDITGSPLPSGAQLVLRGGRGSTPVNTELTPDGRAEFRDLPPGNYRPVLFANSKAYFAVRISSGADPGTPGTAQPATARAARNGTGGTLQLATGENLSATLTVSARLGVVEGLAKRDSGGNGGAMVVLIPLSASRTETQEPVIDTNSDLFRRDQTDLDGSFSLPQVVPGRYLGIAIDDGWTLDWSDPAALKPYLREAVPITVPAGNTSAAVHLPRPLPIQPR